MRSSGAPTAYRRAPSSRRYPAGPHPISRISGSVTGRPRCSWYARPFSRNTQSRWSTPSGRSVFCALNSRVSSDKLEASVRCGRLMTDILFRVGRRAQTTRLACLAIGVLAPVSTHAQDPLSTVTCRGPDDAREREFVLRAAWGPNASAAARWQLSRRDVEPGGAWIALKPPNAAPALTAATAKLSYRNANGGRHVDLDVSEAGSRIDVWVDYGLEVNIEPDLDPRVDRLNTEGPLTALQCTIARPPAAPPHE